MLEPYQEPYKEAPPQLLQHRPSCPMADPYALPTNPLKVPPQLEVETPHDKPYTVPLQLDSPSTFQSHFEFVRAQYEKVSPEDFPRVGHSQFEIDSPHEHLLTVDISQSLPSSQFEDDSPTIQFPTVKISRDLPVDDTFDLPTP